MLRFAAITALSCTVFATTASAYVLPTDFLLRLVAEKRRSQRLTDLSLQLHTERAGADEPIEERLYLKVPERLRRVQQNGESRLYVEREGVRATGTVERLERLRGPNTDLMATFLVPAGDTIEDKGNRMLAALEALEVNVEITSMGRDGGRPVYIIGARPWEPDKPQVWIDKASHMPVRFRVYGTVSGKKTLLDTHLQEYGSPIAGNWFPRIVEVFQDGKLIRHAEVTQAKINQDLPETMFEVP